MESAPLLSHDWEANKCEKNLDIHSHNVANARRLFDSNEAGLIKAQQKKCTKRRLLWGLAGLILLAPAVFLSIYHFHRLYHSHHLYVPADDELVDSFSAWLDSDLPSPSYHSSLLVSYPPPHPPPHHPPPPPHHPPPPPPHHPPPPPPHHPPPPPHHPHPHCTARIPFGAGGTFVVDPTEFSQIKLLVKAKNSGVHVIVEHDQRNGDGDDDGDDGDDDDDDKDKIRIRADIFVDSEKTNEEIQIVEESNNGSYLWSLEDIRIPKRRWCHHRCVLAHVHIRLPASIEDLDALTIGAARGFAESKNLKKIQFGRFKAALGYGNLHFNELRAVSTIGLANVHGKISLDHAWAGTIDLNTVSGPAFIVKSEAHNITNLNTINGELAVEKVKTPKLNVHSVTGDISIHPATTNVSEITSTSGNIHVNISATGHVDIRSLSGSVHANVYYGDKKGGDVFEKESKPTEKKGNAMVHSLSPRLKPPMDKVYQKRAEDMEEGHQLELPAVLAKTLSGSIYLALVKGYEGRFRAKSVTGSVDVDGKRIKFEKDSSHFKSGWVRSNKTEDSPLVVAKSLTGSLNLHFE